MKVLTKIKLLVFFLVINAFAFPQKLVIYHVTGNVNVLTGTKSTVAKRGNILQKNNSLQIKDGASCMLIEEKGKSLQISKAGNYTFEALQKMMVNTGTTGVTQIFFSYVYQNLFSNKSGDKLGVTPVVFRSDDLMQLPFNYTIIISDVFELSWKKPKTNTFLRLTIKDNDEEIKIDSVFKIKASSKINMYTKVFEAGKSHRWKVEESDTHQPKEKYFNFLPAKKKDRKKILQDMKVLQNTRLTKQLRQQLMEDIYIKWKNIYAEE